MLPFKSTSFFDEGIIHKIRPDVKSYILNFFYIVAVISINIYIQALIVMPKLKVKVLPILSRLPSKYYESSDVLNF